jgi:rhomboid protease GluP
MGAHSELAVPSPPKLTDRLRAQVPHLPATWALIAANVLTFAALLTAGGGLWHSAGGVALEWGANFGPATQDGQWWRLGSALFIHFGLLHLSMNMTALWDAGRLVERMFGHRRFLAIYFVAGLAGNLASLVAHGSGTVSAGASGAIFGVYGALLAYVWQERKQIHSFDFRWLFWGALAFMALAISLGFVIAGIDNAAHLGGLATGTLSGFALMPRRGRLVAAAALALSVVGLVGAMPAPKYRWSEETRARSEIRDFMGEDAAITARWMTLMRKGQRGMLSFDELAGNIDADVADRYQASFEELSALKLSGAAPSATALSALRDYAERRRDASRALAEGLRARDPGQIRKALEQASQAARDGGPEQRPPKAPH